MARKQSISPHQLDARLFEAAPIVIAAQRGDHLARAVTACKPRRTIAPRDGATGFDQVETVPLMS